jgi:SAM-dependent methyltransferase
MSSTDIPHLTPGYWNHRYAEERTGWDLGTISPPLQAYIDQLTNKNIAILIPGCGNAYEAEYLIRNGFTNITLLDVSLLLVDKLRSKFENTTGIKIILQNFFEYSGSFDLIFEQTFFCALHPSLRQEYVKKAHELLNPGGRLVGVLFDRFFAENPPFGGSAAEYEALFKPSFSFHTFEKCYNSIKPREGTELFINLIKVE